MNYKQWNKMSEFYSHYRSAFGSFKEVLVRMGNIGVWGNDPSTTTSSGDIALFFSREEYNTSLESYN